TPAATKAASPAPASASDEIPPDVPPPLRGSKAPDKSGSQKGTSADKGASKTPDASGTYSLQTGAFSTLEAAQRQQSQLSTKQYPALIVTEPASTPGPRFHVMVGPYLTRADAQRTAASLQKDGYAAILKR